MEQIIVKPFNDLGINFKEINHSDFEKYFFDDIEKTIITPDKSGYISNDLSKIIDLKKKDTTIINAGVGQGKTKAILEFIKWYYEENKTNKDSKYKIIIVTPFKSLNYEYVRKIISATTDKDVFFEYQDLLKQDKSTLNFKDCYSKDIQLISINSLLGNPGEKAFKQADVKREYFNYFIETCKEKNEKVVFFFDELHESLDNFTIELLPNLFKWKPIIYKIIVASATFSESSKVAIKFLAELTEKKIRIIESKRLQNKNNLSELFLCFYDRPNYNMEDSYLKELFNDIVSIEGLSSINVLCYSSEIAERLFDSKIGVTIKERFSNLNLCVGSPKGKVFNPNGCNIGTTFKTGISIENKDSALVILLPPSYSNKMDYLGIFSDKVNSLTQAIARVRNNSKIFVISPTPKKILIYENQNKSYIKKLSLGFLEYEIETNQVQYQSPSEQDNILHTFYQKIESNILKEIEEVSNLEDDIKAIFNSYDWFKLKKGDSYLQSIHYSYGKDLPAYLYWAAWNNQFVNCKLKAIIKKQPLYFNEGSIQEELDKYFPYTYINEKSFIDFSDKVLYERLRNEIFSNNIYLKKIGIKVNKKITPIINALFEQQIIHFLQRRKTPYLFEPEYGCSYSLKNGDKPIDVQIEKEAYMRICISQCLYVIEQSDKLSKDELLIVNAYNDLYSFKDILLSEYVTKNKKNMVMPININFRFKNMHLIKLKSIFTLLLENDIGFKIFNTRSILIDKSIYALLREIFFETKETMSGTGGKCLRIDREIPMEYSEYKLNLVYNVADPSIYCPVPPKSKYYKIEIVDDTPDKNDNINIQITSIQNNIK